MSNEFFPYNYFSDELELEVANLLIDNVSKISYIDKENNTISLETLEEWDSVECNVLVRLPDTLPAKLSPDESDNNWSVILVAKSMAGAGRQIGWRRKIMLSPDKETNLSWHGKFKLSKENEGSWVQFQSFITRNQDLQKPIKKFAQLQGQRLASSKVWTINIDERISPLGKSIRVEWINFKNDPRFVEYPSNLYFIDFSDSIPVLYLNEAIDDLKVVLSSKGYVGIRSAVRETLFRSIAQSVWLSLVLVAVNDQNYDDEDDRPEWQRSVINLFAPLVVPETLDDEQALKDFLKLNDSQEIFLPKVISAIQSSIDIERSTSRLLSSIIQK